MTAELRLAEKERRERVSGERRGAEKDEKREEVM